MTGEPNPTDIDAIIAAVQQLSPEQRRQLQRRLRVSGLFVPEAAVTDLDRLRVAPALGVRVRQRRVAPQPSPTSPGDLTQRTLLTNDPAIEDALPGAAQVQDRPAPYRSPISGKVVVGGPNTAVAEVAPHDMLPLPGQAPEQPIQIVFDGGSKGNPGKGYGSYELRWPGMQPQVVRLQFGNNVTNNEAEYDTLIAALEAVLKRLQDGGADPATAQLDVRGDSLLVVNQVLGKWKVKEERLGVRCQRVRQLLARFGRWRLSHHDRARSVERLGH
jgi:ribonuclease HI